MHSKENKCESKKNRPLNEEERAILEKIELNEEETKVFQQRKFGFNAFDSAISIILGGILVPVLMTIVGVILLDLISVIFNVSVESVLNIPFIYAIFSCCTILGYGVYVIYFCNKKSKQSSDKDGKSQIKEREVIPNSKCTLKGVIISVCIGALALLLLNLFVNMTTIGLQGLGYSKSNELPFAMDSVGNYLLCLIFLSALPAVCEEFLFRGLILGGMLNSTKSHIQNIGAVLISALIFALCHQSAQQFVFPLLMGTIFGFIYLYMPTMPS